MTTLRKEDLVEITPPRIERMFDGSMWGNEAKYVIPPLRMGDFEITTTVDLRSAMASDKLISIRAFGMTICGYVTSVVVQQNIDGPGWDPNTNVYTLYKVKIRPTGRPVYDSETTPDTKERTVKIYEAVIVMLSDEGEPSEVVKVVAPFVAKSDRAAQDQVLVDYAAESGLKGKDLAGYSVRVRTFQAV